MASTGALAKGEVASLVEKIRAGNTLLVRNLQNICQINGLSRSGVKADLQRRIISLINECVATNDIARFYQVEKSVRDNTNGPSQALSSPAQPAYYPSPPSNSTSSHASQPSYTMPTYNYQPGFGGVNGQKAQASHHQGLAFKPSPFYDIKSCIGDVRVCEVMSQHRNSISIQIKLQDSPALQQCVTDNDMKVMVFCAADRSGIQDIAFPHQSELKVNGGEVKANLRGLKNKPGSTRPVDITGALRLKPPGYVNNVEFTYALTTKKFYLAVYICQTTPVTTLVATIERGRKIQKASVISEITKKAQDTEVIATSQVLSLKCPLTYMRLSLPCRSLSCSHIQCFDATSYLQLQEQGPQWLCPICNKSAPFAQLAVDEYVKDILSSTSKSVEQVTIEPNGKWSVPGARVDDRPELHSASFVDDDDGLIISDISIVGGQSTGTPNRSAPSVGTPMTAVSRESSTMPRSAASNKRPIAQVIDLTLSDDDEPPMPPAKRQNTGFGGDTSFIY